MEAGRLSGRSAPGFADLGTLAGTGGIREHSFGLTFKILDQNLAIVFRRGGFAGPFPVSFGGVKRDPDGFRKNCMASNPRPPLLRSLKVACGPPKQAGPGFR